jgi:hypothetical protein
MEGRHEQNEYRKNLKFHVISRERTEISRRSCEERGGKYEIVTGHVA